MIYLLLFWNFFKIGLFTFGGGYAMIPLIRETVVGMGWLDEETLLNFIGISEATPGAFAINVATFVGYSQAGVLGSIVATFGVVMPSFIVISAIMLFFNKKSKNTMVEGAFKGVLPVICALICATGVSLLLKVTVLINGGFVFDYRAVIVAATVIAVLFGYKKIFNKKMSAYLVMIISAALGMIAFSI